MKPTSDGKLTFGKKPTCFEDDEVSVKSYSTVFCNVQFDLMAINS